MSIQYKGAWSGHQVDRYLQQSDHPLRISAADRDGFPRVISLWYQFQDGSLYAVTHQDSFLATLLRERAKVGFEISPNEPPYRGVRGYGVATLAPLGGKTTLADMLEHYLGGTGSSLGQWLLSRTDEELLITISPHSLFSWDYRKRMAGASAAAAD